MSAKNRWMNIATNGSRADAKRAAYIAIMAAEVIGNLEEAKELALAAYNTYPSAKVKRYLNLLDQRILNQEKVNHQLKIPQN